jgi:predicted Zn-dependent protease
MERMKTAAPADYGPEEKNALTRLRNACWNRAVSYFRREQFDAAAGCISTLLEACPQDAMAHAFLGSIFIRLYRVDDAFQHLDLAAQIAPESPFVRMKMAEYWVALGVPARALEELKKAELSAADNLPLYDSIRNFSREMRSKTRGNIDRTPPAFFGDTVQRMLEQLHLKRPAQPDSGGGTTP